MQLEQTDQTNNATVIEDNSLQAHLFERLYWTDQKWISYLKQTRKRRNRARERMKLKPKENQSLCTKWRNKLNLTKTIIPQR